MQSISNGVRFELGRILDGALARNSRKTVADIDKIALEATNQIMGAIASDAGNNRETVYSIVLAALQKQ